MLHFLLWPFSLLYRAATAVRNHLYDSGFKTSFEFERFVLSIGNLNVGGTGKTPMTEYLIRLLGEHYRIVTLSRGYGRKTRGYRIAGETDSARTIGDEPYQLFRKFPNIHVAVCEERAVGIPFILADYPDTDVILLDDAFQHRPVKPQLSIMLTSFDKPFFQDWVLPAGRLRESRKGAARADVIVVTKCPETMPEKIRQGYVDKIRAYAPDTPVFFSRIAYRQPVGNNGRLKGKVVLFSGIANPAQLRDYVDQHFEVVKEYTFRDHYPFNSDDIENLVNNAMREGASLLTTEKDFRRIPDEALKTIEGQVPVYYLPIETVIDNGQEFDALIRNAIQEYVSAS